jgi:glycosyltransferase involved in cell wall biosynthesis
MKIGIDVSSLHSMSKGRGIGFYIEYLVDSLKKYTDVEVAVFETVGNREKVDLIHYPFFDFFRPTLKVNKNIPTVVTIHDVIPLLFPKHYPPGIRGSINLFRQKQTLTKVKKIITDSETSTKDVITIFKVLPDKVRTVYLAPANYFKKLSFAETKKIIAKFKLPEKFVLYGGGVNWNKNLVNQTEAALKSGLDIVFIGAGFENRNNLSHPELKEFKEFLKRYGDNPQVHILGFVSNEELVALMSASDALLFVSRYEGFGLPVLEAQSCSVPVVTGNTSSMVEVAGDSAEIVNPESVGDICKGLEDAIKNKDGLVKKGFENLKRFSWEKTALETVKVYHEALS